MNNLLQTQVASAQFVSDEDSLSAFIDTLLGVIKLYLAIEEFDEDDENFESTSKWADDTNHSHLADNFFLKCINFSMLVLIILKVV